VASSSAGFDGLEIALRGLTPYVIREIPRREDARLEAGAARRGGDSGRAQRLAALVAAYHAGIAQVDGRAVAFGWVRACAGGPVRVIAAGDALVGSVDNQSAEVMLSLPAGARGAALASGELAGLVQGVGCWREIAGISDGLLAGGGQGGERGSGAERGTGLSLDDGLLGSWSGAFGWLVVAEPGAWLRTLGCGSGLRRRRRTVFLSGPLRRAGLRRGTPSCGAAVLVGSGGLPSWQAGPMR
jgi:hypothetical protein